MQRCTFHRSADSAAAALHVTAELMASLTLSSTSSLQLTV